MSVINNPSTFGSSCKLLLWSLFLLAASSDARPLTGPCKISVANILFEPGEGRSSRGNMHFKCTTTLDAAAGTRLSFPIEGEPDQMQALRNLYHQGDLISGESLLDMPGLDLDEDGEKVVMPPGEQVHVVSPAADGEDPTMTSGSRSRKLAKDTGDNFVLAVKVTDKNGLATSDSAATISSTLFSTTGVNVKTQMEACSFGRLEIFPGDAGAAAAAPGVIEVTIDVDITSRDIFRVENDITQAVEDKLNIGLPGGFDHVMYIVEDCYQGCGEEESKISAYAYLYEWLSVYFRGSHRLTSIQMHEFGHNFGLGHSRGLNGFEYSDHTCFMGNPFTVDLDVGKMCFNVAKMSELQWFTDATPSSELVVAAADQTTPTTFQLIGIADYENNPALPVIVKFEFLTTFTDPEYFIGFNRAIGINSEVVQARDEVVIYETRQCFLCPRQSYLRAALAENESHMILDFAAPDKVLLISVDDIDLVATPAIATISTDYVDYTDLPTGTTFPVTVGGITTNEDCDWVSEDWERCNLITDNGDRIPALCTITCYLTREPTPSPTISPTAKPTPRPTRPPTPSPTPRPTPRPTTAPPTPQPTTAAPTRECFDSTKTFTRNERTRDCSWVANRLKRCNFQTDDGRDIDVLCPKTCNFPCAERTDEPTLSPTKKPTPVPTPNPTPGPTPSPVPPTNKPTPAPTGTCVDINGIFQVRGRTRNCSSISNRPRLCNQQTDDGVDVETLCPESCGFICPDPGAPVLAPASFPVSPPVLSLPCTDSDETFLRRDNRRDCEWVAERPNRRCGLLTDDRRLISSICPATCDIPACSFPTAAPIECEDTTKLFVVDDTFRTCSWVGGDTVNRCQLTDDFTQPLSRLCCETCIA